MAELRIERFDERARLVDEAVLAMSDEVVAVREERHRLEAGLDFARKLDVNGECRAV